MNAVDQMLIEHTCQKLILRYAALTDAGQWSEIADMFTDDATFARPTAPDEIIVGRSAILQAFSARPPAVTQHVVSGIIVEVETPTTASARSILQLFIGKSEGDEPVAAHANAAPLIGTFHDKFVLVDDRWLFSQRHGMLTMK